MIFERTITDKIRGNLDNDYVLVVVGARQAGKTTLLRTIHHEVEARERHSYFLNLERLDLVSLLNSSPENLFRIIPPITERATVFIDEIQYLENPTNFLKYLYDEYRDRLKLVVSGSSAFYIDQKFRDSLAGRKRIFHLHSLNFGEFLRFRQREELLRLLPEKFDAGNFTELSRFPKLYTAELLTLFSEYGRFGGYPRVVLADSEEEKRMVLEDLVNSSVKKDILESKVRFPERYFDMLKVLAAQSGGLLNRNELARILQLSTQAVEHYLYVMQKSFQIALVKAFHSNMRKEITKMPKVFFLDMGVRNYLLNDFGDFALRADKGAFLENLVFRQLLGRFALDDIRFWRTQDKNELDFVVAGRFGFEVKANPRSFLPAKYESFRARNPDIFIDVVTHDQFVETSGYRVWGAWGI